MKKQIAISLMLLTIPTVVLAEVGALILCIDVWNGAGKPVTVYAVDAAREVYYGQSPKFEGYPHVGHATEDEFARIKSLMRDLPASHADVDTNFEIKVTMLVADATGNHVETSRVYHVENAPESLKKIMGIVETIGKQSAKH